MRSRWTGPALLGITLLFLPPLLSPGPDVSAAETGDSCVECHSNPKFMVTDRKLYNYFLEWQSSIHRQEDVTCSDCHGGDPDNPTRSGAHQGDVSASQRQSAVNFENIPDTCGGCHEDISNGYRQSQHFKQLVSSEDEAQGPNCVTCHGSISVAALNVNTVKDACLRCHNEESGNSPEVPEKAKLLLNRFLSIHRYYRYITIRGEPDKTRTFFQNLDPQLESLSTDWHTFDLERIEEKTWNVLTLLRERRKEVRRQQLGLSQRISDQ